MSSDHAEKIWDLFERVVELPAEQQNAALDSLCGGDAALRAKIVGMLAADRHDDALLDNPVASLPEPPAGRLASGSRVGPYRILRLLDEGGMGSVYLAARDDDAFSRRVVLKLVRAGMETSQILERLKTERRILAGLDHPYITRLYDGGSTEDGRPFFVLEYIEGETIDIYCRKNALSVDERLLLFVKVCEAVQFAHQNLVIHRDLKPRNIMVTSDGDPKLLDFGIAKLVNPDLAGDALDPTDPILRIATPNYASPEQLRGDVVTTASDVYSLGVLLYQLLTGRLPYQFAGLSLAEIEQRLAHTTPVAPSVAVTRPIEEPDGSKKDDAPAPPPGTSRLPRDLDAIVLKALRSVPRQRYGSAEQLAEDVQRFRQGRPVSAHAGTWAYMAGKFLRRNRAPVAFAAGFALVLAGFAVAFGLQARRVAAERDIAHLERDKKAQVLSLVLELFRLANPYVEPGQELTVREAVERSVGVLGDSLQDQPAVRAELLLAAGGILYDLGVNEQAQQHFTEALDLQRQLEGDGHFSLAVSTSALAGTYKQLGDLERAEQLARQAVEMARGAAGDTAPEQAASWLIEPINELVSVLCYRSEYENAEPAAQEALDLADALPETAASKIVALEHLARIKNAAGDYRQAARLNREALALRRQRAGELHPAQLATLNNLGSSLRRSGELEAADQAYSEALEIYRFNFGDRATSRVLPALLNNLATVLVARGELERAGQLFEEALQVVGETLGPEHWLSFHFAGRRALVRARSGEPAEAAKDLRGLLEIWQPRLGENWRFHEARGLLGESLSLQGRCDEAKPLLVQSFEQLLEAAGASAQQAAFTRLADHLRRCGDAVEIDDLASRLPADSDAT